MQDRHYDFDGGKPFFRVDIDRDAAPVVLNRTGSVFVQDDLDVAGVSGEGFVDRVIDGFIDELV
jgi:hypothetical protein